MLSAILACENPYETAKKFERAGWTISASNPPDSGDPLVNIELFGNRLMLGVTEEYVDRDSLPYVGCGVEFYITVPKGALNGLHDLCTEFSPSVIKKQMWGDTTFEVEIDGFRLMIAAH
jgi:hypothetical protein